MTAPGELVGVGVASLLVNAGQLGLTWRLRTATVQGSGLITTNPIVVIIDGSSASIGAYSMIGTVIGGERIYVLLIPPAGIFILGRVVTSDLLSPDVQLFTTDGDWSKPLGATRVRVQCQGAGSGGGGAAATSASQFAVGGGAQGGGYAESWFDAVELADSEPVVVGAGGVGNAGGSGSPGGTSSFSSGSTLVSAGAGFAGIGGAATTQIGGTQGNSGAVSMTGDIQINGSPGTLGIRLGTAGNQTLGGAGGDSHLGSGGKGAVTNAGGSPGQNYGGSGGGAANGGSAGARAGGNGAPGIVIITTFVH